MVNRLEMFKAIKASESNPVNLADPKIRSELLALAGERLKIDFGSQISSHVMQPYQLVKD